MFAKILTLALFIIVVMGAGSAIGILTAPGPWFAALQKPFFNPPAWVFGPVWSLLYLLIAIAGWRVWVLGRDTELRRLWSIQMVLNFLWSPVFFAAQIPALALLIILCMLVTIALFIAKSWSRNRISSVLFMPYAAWVAFATLLNAAIVVLN